MTLIHPDGQKRLPDFVCQFSAHLLGPANEEIVQDRFPSDRLAAVLLDGEGNVLFGPKLHKDPIAAHEKNGTMLLRKLLKCREGMR